MAPGSWTAAPVRALARFDRGRDHGFQLLRFIELPGDVVFGG
jgi:hypothetical protein